MWLLKASLVLCIADAAISDMVAYDTFSYAPGEIVGQSAPSLGFTGAWGGGGGNLSQCTVQASSLVYPGADAAFQNSSGMGQVRIAAFEGGRAGRFLDTDPNGPFAGYINSQGSIGKPGQSIYLSFLMRTSHGTPFYGLEFKRFDLGDNGARLYIGNDVGGSNLQVCAYRNRDLSAGNIGREFQWLDAATTDPELFVVRIDFGITGDNVTVYRNPSPEAEPIMLPHLVNSRFLDFNAITLAAWVDPAGRVAQFDEICFATTYADAVRLYNMPTRAQNPTPADGTVDVIGGSGIQLGWNAGTGVTATGYKVYFSNVLDDVLTESEAAYQGTTTSTNLTIDTINTDTTYYWSVTEIAEPNDISGVVWMFETNKTYPMVVNQPSDQFVFPGETASFTLEVTSATPASYQWFDANGPLSDSGSISGSQTATLMITNAQVANEGNYYCEVINNAGTVTSDVVRLLVKRLVGYWALNQTADPNLAWQDMSDSQNDLQPWYNVPEAFEWAEGADGTAGGALVFNGGFGLGTKKADGTMNDIPIGNDAYTISFWFKANIQPVNGVGLFGWGNYGNYNQTNAFGIWRDSPNRIQNYWWDNDLNADRGYSLTDEQWHQVVSTYDGDLRTMYIDGIRAASDNPVPHNVQTSENFMIGKTNMTGSVTEFVGAMDEVKVYNYALTGLDVAKSFTDIRGGELCFARPSMDLNNDCTVNLSDFSALAGQWLECGLVPTCMN